MAAKPAHNKFMETTAEAESVKLKMPKSTQTEAFAFAGSSKSTLDTIAYDKQPQKRAKATTREGATKWRS